MISICLPILRHAAAVPIHLVTSTAATIPSERATAFQDWSVASTAAQITY